MAKKVQWVARGAFLSSLGVLLMSSDPGAASIGVLLVFAGVFILGFYAWFGD